MQRTMSSLRRSRMSMCTSGWVSRYLPTTGGRYSVMAVVLANRRSWPLSPSAYCCRSPVSISSWERMMRACCR
ncbi:hypothetical protein D9M69_622530 [compost metagenome]